MNRSQRILVAIGIAALLALAAPYLTRAVVDNRAISGKQSVFTARSAWPRKDLVLCLIRPPGPLGLSVASNDLYTNPAGDLAVRVRDKGQYRTVEAWLPQGRTLSAEQLARLRFCAASAPEVQST